MLRYYGLQKNFPKKNLFDQIDIFHETVQRYLHKPCFLLRDEVWNFTSYCYNKTEVCGLIEEFVDKNEDYIASMVSANPTDPYWYQMKLYYIQIEGLAVGYNQATTDPYEWLTC